MRSNVWLGEVCSAGDDSSKLELESTHNGHIPASICLRQATIDFAEPLCPAGSSRRLSALLGHRPFEVPAGAGRKIKPTHPSFPCLPYHIEMVSLVSLKFAVALNTSDGSKTFD